MKKWLLAVALVAVCVSTATALVETNELYFVGAQTSSATAVSIRARGDYIAVPVMVSIDPDAADRDRQIRLQRDTVTALLVAVHKNRSQLVVKFNGFREEPYVYVMTRVEDGEHDMAYYHKQIETLFKPIFFSGKAKCSLGSPVLAIRDPEQYRSAIIGRIIASVESLSKALESSVEINISGLENSVVAEPLNDEYVELHIPYRLSLEIVRDGTPTYKPK